MSTKKYALGSLFSIPDLRDYVATSEKKDFPTEFELENMPEVKNQGSVGSCVAHALSTTVEYFNEKESGQFTKMSTAYIYGNRLLTTHKGTGMYTRDALKTLSKYGDVSNEQFPGNVEVPEAIEKFDANEEKLRDKGVPYRIESYFKLDDENAIKAHLMDGNPVVMSMYWYDDITIKNGVMVTNLVKTASTGGHCMVIYGWNETGWKVQNSWGKTWGKKGKFILPYAVPMKEVWGVKDAVSNTSLDITTPFKSKIGAWFAKVVHKVISAFYKIFNK